jgi:hypothetical protein
MRLQTVAVVLFAIAGCARHPPSAAYEYGQLYHKWDRNFESQNIARWEVAESSVEGRTLPDVYRRLGGKKPDDKVALLEVLNVLGASGWELVYVSPIQRDESGSVAYYFRRAVPAPPAP